MLIKIMGERTGCEHVLTLVFSFSTVNWCGIYPCFTAISRDNDNDPLLILAVQTATNSSGSNGSTDRGGLSSQMSWENPDVILRVVSGKEGCKEISTETMRGCKVARADFSWGDYQLADFFQAVLTCFNMFKHV